MPQETKKEPVAGTHEKPTLQGLVATREDEAALLGALEKAFDYRGDVTLTLTDGSSVEGYLFDRRRGDSLETSIVRIMPADGPTERRAIPFSRIERVEISGKDAAHGKSFERWVRRFTEKKLVELGLSEEEIRRRLDGEG